MMISNYMSDKFEGITEEYDLDSRTSSFVSNSSIEEQNQFFVDEIKKDGSGIGSKGVGLDDLGKMPLVESIPTKRGTIEQAEMENDRFLDFPDKAELNNLRSLRCNKRTESFSLRPDQVINPLDSIR